MSIAFTIPLFERLLLLADASALAAHNLPDAAAVAAGSFYIFLPDHPHAAPFNPDTTLSLKIAHQCIRSASENIPIHSTALLTAFTEPSSSSHYPLLSAYVAGVALLQAFIRQNWTGPSLHFPESSDNATDSFFLSLDGEDVARPAKCLHWLRAAKYILVDSLSEFIRNGATLAPWWAARALLAHQSILSGPAPTIQYQLFTLFGRFLGPSAAETRYLFSDNPTTNPAENIHDSDSDDDSLFPAPVADGHHNMQDEDADFLDVLHQPTLEDTALKVLAYIELALAQKMFYDADAALASLKRASQLEAIVFSISGEMGVRTKHQTKETSQLIARAYHIRSSSLLPATTGAQTAFVPNFPHVLHSDNNSSPSPPSSDWMPSVDVAASLPLPKNVRLNDSDVLGYIKLSDKVRSQPVTSVYGQGSDSDDEEQIVLEAEREYLTPIQQALALCHATLVRARSASHILTKEQMAPFVDLVLRNSSSPYGTSSVIQVRALLLRVSFERDRGRYLERCMAQMEELGNFLENPLKSQNHQYRDQVAAERNLMIFSSALPPRWEVSKEIAISFGKIGLVKSAMAIFEKLEFWDELVDCHRLIGNLEAAKSMVLEQLDLLDSAMLVDGIATSDDLSMDGKMKFGHSRAVQARASRRPRLLCVLGDVTRDRKHYETAWKESGFRYARAKRALARMCVEAEEWEESLEHFKAALEINSLFPEVWFTYGCAALKSNNIHTAAHAFTRVVQQTPENGEAWNNLGRVLHELGKPKESLKALIQAAKVNRDSWHIWDNVLLLAMELRSSSDIVRAMDRLLDIRGKDGVNEKAIGLAASEVIRLSSSSTEEDKASAKFVCERLLNILGRCTSLVSTNATVWAAYAELHELVPGVGSKQIAFDCRLKQVRSLIAIGEWKREIRMFRHMAIATDALVKNAMESENSLNVRAAEMHVKSVIEQTQQDFLLDEGFTRLKEAERRFPEREFKGTAL